jgi:hypothetical protein
MPVLATKSTRKAWVEVKEVPLLATSVDSNVYIARRNCKVQDIRFVLTTAGGAGATVTVKKCSGTTAPASGTAISSAMDLNATALNTVTAATLTQSATYLNAGDRLAIDVGGTLTALVGMLEITLETY